MAAKKTAKKPATKSSQKSANKSATKKTSTSKKQPNSRTKVEENMQSRKKLNPQVKAILLCAVAVIFFALLIIEGDNVWFAVRSFVFGVFGFCFVLIPFVFLYLGILTAKEKEMSHKGAKIALSSLIVVFVCTLIYLCGKTDFNEYSYFNALSEAYTNSSIHMSMCGLLGSVLGYPFRLWLTNAPAIIITVLALIVMIMLLTGITLIDIANLAKKRYEVHRDNRNIRRQRKAERELSSQNDSQAELVSESYDVDDSIYYGSGRRADDNVRIDIPLDKVKKKKKPMSSEDIEDQRIIDIINNANEGLTPDEELDATEVAMRISKSKNTSRKTSGAKQPDPETVPVDVDFDIDEEKEKFEKELKKTQRKNEKSVSSSMSISSDEDETPSYLYPPVTLLDPSIDSEGSSAMNEMQNNATKLVDTLKSFGVAASITNICRGPSVTRYELQPAPGVKISKITNLSDDIALNLAANGVRIEAPIPGKAAVGIEVPNKVTSMVSLRELIDSNEFYNSKSKLTCVLGRDISGNVVLTDLSKLPHLLIAGTTGSGKSVCVNSLLMSILFKSSPDEVKLLLIDPKMVEFSKYKGIPHLLVPVVSDAKKAAGSLSWAVSEMLNRYKTFSEYDCKDINSFNKLIDKNLEYIKENTNDDMTEEEKNEVALEVEGLKVPKERMSRIVIAIDELADLMMASPAEVEEAICRLAQMARAAGMHLIIATQRPSVNVITGVIKANIPSRIALKVSSNVDSRTILDNGGAEKLIGRGDMLYSPVGANKPLRVQGCFAKDEEIERVTAYIKEKHRANYNDEIEQKIRKIAAEELSGSGKSKDSPSSSDAPEVDALMEEAIKTVIEQKQASTSLLQRRLKVGYARAGRMIDDMEQMGIVGPHQGSKAREVLITYNEWLERNNALNINPDDTVDYYDEEDE